MTGEAPTSMPGRRPRVLIVDDEPEIVRALALRLTAAGYEVMAAADGVQAISTAIREQPDVIVLDIGLPGGDGHTVAARLGQTIQTLHIPVIFVTARTSMTDAQRARDAGAVGYLVKPYDSEELLACLTKAIGR